MTRKLILHTVISLFSIYLYSCNGTTSRQDDRTINLTQIQDQYVAGMINNISTGILFIPLETNDSILLNSNVVIKLIDDENIIVESNRRLHRFNKDGKFIGFIGNIGNGPGEYIAPGRVSYDEQNKLLYLFTNKQLQNWTLSEFLKSTDFPNKNTLSSVSLLTTDTLLAIRRDYYDGGKLLQYIQWCDLDGNIFTEKEFKSDSTKMNIAIYASPEHYRIRNTEYFRNEWSNEIYTIKSHDIELYKKLDFGNKNPNRFIYSTQRDLLGDKYVNLIKTFVTPKIIFIEYIEDRKLNYLAIENTGNVIHHSTSTNDYTVPSGLSIDGITLNFWPSYLDSEGNSYAIINPGDLSPDELLQFNRKQNLERPILDTDNPIICAAKTK